MLQEETPHDQVVPELAPTTAPASENSQSDGAVSDPAGLDLDVIEAELEDIELSMNKLKTR